jgi:hypothetical protein
MAVIPAFNTTVKTFCISSKSDEEAVKKAMEELDCRVNNHMGELLGIHSISPDVFHKLPVVGYLIVRVVVFVQVYERVN